MKSCHYRPPLDKYFAYAWKHPLLASLWKNPSDATLMYMIRYSLHFVYDIMYMIRYSLHFITYSKVVSIKYPKFLEGKCIFCMCFSAWCMRHGVSWKEVARGHLAIRSLL